ncbi:digestive cysteine proteinase 1-like [Tribolium madens]|uniref:digestive cysteine proteinase 1-like n=1 Tax=Tribolium madens TaxID=41895 RepID=UPI001CF742E8|nr:digestive cysteine proteinase 1-like [Tribolium madens]XP_044264523.1 digestive cysteine proteinase 1-like [Tribolium madens]
MKLLLLFIVAMSAYTANCALTDAEVSQKFNEFKSKYGKTYADANEENFRKQLFAKNLEKIEEHNKKYEQGQVTYTMGVNQFSDLTPEEMRPYTHGVLRPQN